VSANRNIFACLLHERPDCVLDLIRNLHYFDPDSLILLYNGGHDHNLLYGIPLDRYNAVVHPTPSGQVWGKLHGFALDSMSFALDNFAFSTLTIVDSDQLVIRPHYSQMLFKFLESRTKVGLLGNPATHQRAGNGIAPVKSAYRELTLWRPFLRRFAEGERKFVHWVFWPTTVFTAEAAKDLRQLFERDQLLQEIMRRSRIWASEEVIFPTLVALLGYELCHSPFSYDYVQYKRIYSAAEIRDAQQKEDVFWIHPVPRQLDNPLRHNIRSSSHNYGSADPVSTPTHNRLPANENAHLLCSSILRRMNTIDGWLAEDEAELLVSVTSTMVSQVPKSHSIVEIGSYCGRSTIVLGSIIEALSPESRLYAIDPHDGRVGALDASIQNTGPTLEKLKYNLAAAGLTDVVTIIPSHSWEVAWNQPISLLFVDALHDYASVSRDFLHFEAQLQPGSFVAFHDYADYYPGVKTFVNQLLNSRRYVMTASRGSLIVLQDARAAPLPLQTALSGTYGAGKSDASVSFCGPLVSCIMPTADRRRFVAQAIAYFAKQTYTNRELLILDDGIDSVADLVAPDPRIRYLRLPRKISIGAKHNLACEMAKGEIIIHWDDDDWMSECRVAYQVGELQSSASLVLCGLSRVIVYEAAADRAWEYVYPRHERPWVCGGSFCYRKQLWERNRFPNISEGADTLYVWGLRGGSVHTLDDPTFYVAVVHADNSSRKRISGPRWRPYDKAKVRQLMQTDWTFYRETSIMTRSGMRT
jgi:predicted O-methyltransferase YrrM